MCSSVVFKVSFMINFLSLLLFLSLNSFHRYVFLFSLLLTFPPLTTMLIVVQWDLALASSPPNESNFSVYPVHISNRSASKASPFMLAPSSAPSCSSSHRSLTITCACTQTDLWTLRAVKQVRGHMFRGHVTGLISTRVTRTLCGKLFSEQGGVVEGGDRPWFNGKMAWGR